MKKRFIPILILFLIIMGCKKNNSTLNFLGTYYGTFYLIVYTPPSGSNAVGHYDTAVQSTSLFVTSSTSLSRVELAGPVFGGAASGTLNGNNLTIDSQDVAGVVVDGSGTLLNGNQLTLATYKKTKFSNYPFDIEYLFIGKK
jgi:hypothetical protein